MFRSYATYAVSVTQVSPRLYAVAEYQQLVERGVLGTDDRVELLEGVIVEMSPQTPRHASATHRCAEALRRAVGGRAVVRTQLPLMVGHRSLPEPDVSVVPGRVEDYDEHHPDRALLVVEVAETSLAHDRLMKAGIYAAAAVPEYWIVNLRDDCVEVHRGPREGRYTPVTVVTKDGRIDVEALSDSSLLVNDIMPVGA